MNVSASKLLLGISLAAYTYVLRAHIFGMSDSPARASAAPPPAAPPKELTAAMVNRTVALKLGKDPFGMSNGPIAPRATTGPATAPTTKPATQATTAPTSRPATPPVVRVPVKLEGVLFGPSGRAAVINGQAVKLGETIRVERGTKITAIDIGIDSVVVKSGEQTLTLRLPKPPTEPDFDAPTAQAQSPPTPPPRTRRQGVANVPNEP